MSTAGYGIKSATIPWRATLGKHHMYKSMSSRTGVSCHSRVKVAGTQPIFIVETGQAKPKLNAKTLFVLGAMNLIDSRQHAGHSCASLRRTPNLKAKVS